MDKTLTMISWDEIGGEATAELLEEAELPQTATDDELVNFLRAQNEDSDEEDLDLPWGTDWLGRENTWGWRAAVVTRGTNTATVEWRSDRNHHAVTTLIWS